MITQINKINISYLLATIYVFHSKHRKQIFDGYNWDAFKWNKFMLAWVDQILIRSRFFIKNRFYSRNENVTNNVPDIGMAIKQVSSSLDKTKMIKVYGINPK